MGWLKRDLSTDKFTVGIFTSIPNRGYVGWVCSWTGDTKNGANDGIYACASKFIALSDFSLTSIPDFE